MEQIQQQYHCDLIHAKIKGWTGLFLVELFDHTVIDQSTCLDKMTEDAGSSRDQYSQNKGKKWVVN